MRRRVSIAGLALVTLTLGLVIPAGAPLTPGTTAEAQEVGEKALLDNERLTMIELVFPAGFKGEEHAAVADEFAYVLDGEFALRRP